MYLYEPTVATTRKEAEHRRESDNQQPRTEKEGSGSNNQSTSRTGKKWQEQPSTEGGTAKEAKPTTPVSKNGPRRHEREQDPRTAKQQ